MRIKYFSLILLLIIIIRIRIRINNNFIEVSNVVSTVVLIGDTVNK